MSVDLSRIDRVMLDRRIGIAQSLQQAGKRAESAAAWNAAARQAEAFAASAKNPAERDRRLRTAAELSRLAASLSTELAAEHSGTARMHAPASEYRHAAQGLVMKSGVRLQDIAGLEQTKQQLLMSFALSRATAPEGVTLPQTSRILLYGPPGCGKTLLAAAVSGGFQSVFFNVKVGDLMSRYFGETEKLLQAVYDEARTHPAAVVFLDEIDAIARSRDSADNGTERRLLVCLLTELDGLREKDGSSNVITIAATNHPWCLDKAILSRFERHILIPLPDAAVRRQILERQLTGMGYQLAFPLGQLVEQTEGLSGRELKILCNLLKEEMIRSANQSLTELAECGDPTRNSLTVRVQPITDANLSQVRHWVRPAVTAADIQRFDLWRSAEN